MLTKKAIEQTLDTVLDPELGISIVQMGLIYGVDVDPKGNVRVLMTLTTMGCPLSDMIADMVKRTLGEIKGVRSVTVDLTFEPPWTLDKMSTKAKKKLGIS